MAYQVKKEFSNKLELTTLLNGKRIALVEKFDYKEPDTAKKPGKVVTIQQATQAELKALFEQGNPCIEFIDKKSGGSNQEHGEQDKPEQDKQE